MGHKGVNDFSGVGLVGREHKRVAICTARLKSAMARNMRRIEGERVGVSERKRGIEGEKQEKERECWKVE